MQRIKKLTVRIILRILSHGSDNFLDQQKKFAFNILLKVYFKYFYIPAEATVLTTKVSNTTRTIAQVTSIDEQPTT